MGNKRGLDYDMKSTGDEWGGLSFSDPPWVVLKFIFLKAGVWAQASLKASSESNSFIYLSLCLRCIGRRIPLHSLSLYVFCYLCFNISCSYPSPPSPATQEKHKIPTTCTIPSSLPLLASPLILYPKYQPLFSAPRRPEF